MTKVLSSLTRDASSGVRPGSRRGTGCSGLTPRAAYTGALPALRTRAVIRPHCSATAGAGEEEPPNWAGLAHSGSGTTFLAPWSCEVRGERQSGSRGSSDTPAASKNREPSCTEGCERRAARVPAAGGPARRQLPGVATGPVPETGPHEEWRSTSATPSTRCCRGVQIRRGPAPRMLTEGA